MDILIMMRQNSPIYELKERISAEGRYENVKLYTTDNMREGLYLLHRCSFELIIIDTLFAKNEMEGIGFARMVRDIERYCLTEMVIFSSLVDEQLYCYSKLHCYAYYEYPCNMKEAFLLIDKIIDYQLASKRKNNTKFIKLGASIYPINCNDIVMINCYSKYTYIVTKERTWQINSRHKKEIFSNLDMSGYAKCNKNNFVNVDYILKIDTEEKLVEVRGEFDDIQYSRRAKNKILGLIDIINLNNNS